jgi:hypothetical protein
MIRGRKGAPEAYHGRAGKLPTDWGHLFNRFIDVAEHRLKPFISTANPDKIVAVFKPRHQAKDSTHASSWDEIMPMKRRKL